MADTPSNNDPTRAAGEAKVWGEAALAMLQAGELAQASILFYRAAEFAAEAV